MHLMSDWGALGHFGTSKYVFGEYVIIGYLDP